MSEKQKYIRRAVHDKQNPYLLFKRTTAQDKSLSYEARGMLLYILSQRDDWRVQPNELIIEGCGRDKVYRILKELIESKYIEHEKSFNEQHKITWGDYIVHEYSYTENPDTESQDMDLREKPFPENPDTENTHINKYLNTKVSKESTRKRSIPRTTKPIPATNVTALHPLIDAWATVRGIDKVNIGAPIFSAADLRLAKRMAKWDVPPTVDEITTAIKNSKSEKYRFDWLEKDIPVIRLEKSKQSQVKPDEPVRDQYGFTVMERARLIYAETHGERNHD